MASTKPHPVLRFLRRLSAGGPADGSDGQLLARFAGRRDEAAFATLMQRHGAMVFGVCARVLGRTPDAEDAFQATFLVLARKAAALREPDSVASWFYGVAHRTALKARSTAATRRARERQVAAVDGTFNDEPERRDLRRLLDDELSRLPEKYRTAVVLCYLEGQTHEEAAQLLGCPRKTITTRLTRACQRLRDRLVRRGLALSAAALGVALAAEAEAAAPAALTKSTLEAATLFAAGGASAVGVVPARVVALVKGVLQAMFITRLKTAVVVLLIGIVLSGAVVALAVPLAATEPPQKAPPADKAPMPPKEDAALKELQGDWKVISMADNGRKTTDDDVKGMRWTFKGNKLQPTDPGDKTGDPIEFKLDASKDPKQIDLIVLTGDLKGTTIPAIYKLEEGRLTICQPDEKHLAKGRPTKFDGEKGSDQGVIVLEKIKPEAEQKADKAKALKEVQGEWQAVANTANGKQLPEDLVKQMRWVIKDTTVESTNAAGKPRDKMSITLDPNPSPHTIVIVALEGVDKDKKWTGIYKLEKDEFTICVAHPGTREKWRPTTFTSEKGSGFDLITLERAK